MPIFFKSATSGETLYVCSQKAKLEPNVFEWKCHLAAGGREGAESGGGGRHGHSGKDAAQGEGGREEAERGSPSVRGLVVWCARLAFGGEGANVCP